MKSLSIRAALCLSGCALNTQPPGPVTDLKLEGITAGAVAGEIAVRARCPRSTLETAVLLSLRLTFDTGVGFGLPEPYQRRIVEARDETNRVCGIAA